LEKSTIDHLLKKKASDAHGRGHIWVHRVASDANFFGDVSLDKRALTYYHVHQVGNIIFSGLTSMPTPYLNICGHI